MAMSLHVNVAGLLKDAPGATRAYVYEGPWEQEEPAAVHAKATLNLTRTDLGVGVSGPVELAFDADCSRCLVPFTTWVQLDLDEEYLPLVDSDDEAGSKQVAGAMGSGIDYNDEESDVFRIDVRHEIDLNEAVRQYGIASMPLAPVCREDCAGLCSTCGTNLNDAICDCESELDPRLAHLKDLFASSHRE